MMIYRRVYPVVRDSYPVVRDSHPVVHDSHPVVRDSYPLVRDSYPVVLLLKYNLNSSPTRGREVEPCSKDKSDVISHAKNHRKKKSQLLTKFKPCPRGAPLRLGRKALGYYSFSTYPGI